MQTYSSQGAPYFARNLFRIQTAKVKVQPFCTEPNENKLTEILIYTTWIRGKLPVLVYVADVYVVGNNSQTILAQKSQCRFN